MGPRFTGRGLGLTTKILIVEDDVSMRTLLSAVVGGREDFDLKVVSDGSEALHVARTEQPRLILLDIKLPGMDGFQICHVLKRDESTQHIKIIMVTALAQESDRRKALNAGADDYVTKPFSPIDLRARVDGALGPHSPCPA